MLSDTVIVPPEDAESTWVVLDVRRDEGETEYAFAYRLGTRGRGQPIFARWRQLGDSIELQETSTFPGASWMLRVQGDSLVGRGLMIHDVVHRDSSGKWVNDTSEWRARAKRIPCRNVP